MHEASCKAWHPLKLTRLSMVSSKSPRQVGKLQLRSIISIAETDTYQLCNFTMATWPSSPLPRWHVSTTTSSAFFCNKSCNKKSNNHIITTHHPQTKTKKSRNFWLHIPPLPLSPHDPTPQCGQPSHLRGWISPMSTGHEGICLFLSQMDPWELMVHHSSMLFGS